jgi:hypothetical protein
MQNEVMKKIWDIKSRAFDVAALILMLICSGCVATNKVNQKAEQNPAYDLLLPIALPADLVVSPAVGIYYVYTVHNQMSPHGDGLAQTNSISK